MTRSFHEAPQELRSWLGSDGVTFYLIDLNNRLSLADYGMTLIPNLIYRLVIHDLPAQNFTSTLSEELEIAPSSAKEIAKEIEKKVLEPVRRALLEWGVDITLIQIGDVVKEDLNVEEKIIGSAPLPALPKEGEKIAPPPPPAGGFASPRPAGSSGGSFGGGQMTSFEDKLRVIGSGDAPTGRPGGVRIVEQTPTAPSFTATAPKVIESASPTLNTAPVRLTEEQKREVLAEKLNTMTKPIGIPGNGSVAAKAPPKEVPLPPQEIKPVPRFLPTLKAEGDKIKLKEDAPFMLHEEKKLEPTSEAGTFKSNIEFAPPKPAPKSIAARVEMGDAIENKPRVVHYSEMRSALPAMPGVAPQAGLSPEITVANKPATPAQTVPPGPTPPTPAGLTGGPSLSPRASIIDAPRPVYNNMAAKEPVAWKNTAQASNQPPPPVGGPTPRPVPPPTSGLAPATPRPPAPRQDQPAQSNVVDLR